MNKIKVIKKNHSAEIHRTFQSVETKLKPNPKPLETARVIENWVARWRARKKSEYSRAAGSDVRLELNKDI